MKLLFYDGFDKCSKCIYLLGIELLELIGKSIHSIGRFLTEIEKFLWSYVEVLTYIKNTYGKDAYKLAKKLLITVNGDGITILDNMRTRLSPGDTVSFLPVCGGG